MVLRDGAGTPRWADKEGFRGTAAVSVPEAHVLTYTVSVTAFRLHKWAHMAPGVSRLGLPLACRPFLPATLGSPRGSLLPLLKGQKGCVKLGSQVKTGVSSCGCSWLGWLSLRERPAVGPRGKPVRRELAPEPPLPGLCRQKVAVGDTDRWE